MFEIGKVLSQKKFDASLQAKQNEKKALQVSGVEEFDDRRKELILEIANARFEGKDTIELRKELERIIKNENSLLKKINLTVGDFEPKVICEKCADTGYVGTKICSCAKKIASKLLLEKSGFKKTLSKFSDNKPIEGNEQIYKKMQEWTENDLSKNKIILFVGGTGTGKSYLMECMAEALINRGNFVFFTTAFNLVQTCLKYHTAFNENKNGLLDSFLDSDVLFIDDLGTEPMLKNVTIEYLLMILNERLSRNLRTVISTNLLQEQIEQKYDERVFSRIFDKRNGIAIKFEGKDLRITKADKKVKL